MVRIVRRLIGRLVELWLQSLLYMYGGGLEGRREREGEGEGEEEPPRKPVVTEFDWLA